MEFLQCIATFRCERNHPQASIMLYAIDRLIHEMNVTVHGRKVAHPINVRPRQMKLPITAQQGETKAQPARAVMA